MNFSGGPLMALTSDGLWLIIGITSYGKGCGQRNELGVYTHVSMYLKWIHMAMRNLEGYRSRSFDKLNNVFLNSAYHIQISLFILFYSIVIKMNTSFFH